MALFPKLTFDSVVQIDDMIRLDASRSFVNENEEITDILIEPFALAGFISVFNNGNSDKWFLDTAYESNGMKDVSVRYVTALETKTKTYNQGVNVLDEDEDALLSDDNDIIPYEFDILKYLPKGRNSFLYVHRKAQERILDYLDEQRMWKNDQTRYTKQDLVDFRDTELTEQFRRWSSMQALLIIFESIQVSVDDVFQEKKRNYEALMIQARNRSALRLDQDGDGELDITPYDIRTTRLVRR